MKKLLLKSLAVIYAFAFCNTSAFAADPDFENDYTLVKSATFGGAEATNIAGSVACDYTAYDTGNKKQQTLTVATAPSDAAGWIAFQAWTDGSGKGWWNRANNSLYCYNAGRSAAVFGSDLTIGWIVVFECKNQASTCMTLVNGDGDPDGTFNYVTSEDGKSYFCTINAKENAYVGFCGNKNAQGITKISVYKPNKAVVPTTYKVAYVDGDNNVLKDTVEYNGIAGVSVSVTDADKANISYEGNTYLYSSDNSADVTIAEDSSSVVTVTFRKAANFTYTVKEVYGDVVLRETTGTSYETASVTVPYRKYNTYEGKLYTKGATNKEYNYNFKLTTDNQVETLSYDEVAGVENVVFLTEGEDIEGMTACTTANTGIRSSNSSSAFASEDVKIANLDNGTYKMHAVIYDASKEPNSNWIFYLNDATQTEAGNFTCTTVNFAEFESEFAVKSSTDLMFSAAGSASMGIDMLYIVKTGDYNYLDIDSWLPDTLTYYKGNDIPQLSDYYTYTSSQTNEKKFTASMGLVKVEPGTAKDAVEYNIYDNEMAVKLAFVQGGLGTYYAFGKVKVEYEDGKKDSVYTDTIVIEIMEKEAEPIVSTHTWDFTQFSETTVANLIADAAESKTSGWSDVEKKADAEAGADPTALSKDNCFWFADNANLDGYLTANGQVIEELEGLVFHNNTYNNNRSIAIAVNYGTIDTSKDFGPYNGPSYLWLGGKNFDAFTIKNVKAGTLVTMGVESHKITDARGVKLFVDGVELTDGDGVAVPAPTTYTVQTWVVPGSEDAAVGAKGGSLSANDGDEVVDVIVKNTNGCHIYFIDAEIGEPTPDAIETVSEDASNAGVKKIFENGKIVILNGAAKFNAAGAQVK